MTERTESATGGCLCGGVRYEAAGPMVEVLQCHCENCRRLTGNFTAAVRTSTDRLEIASPTDVFDWYDVGYARYGFCRGCGSSLFFRAADRQELTSVFVGTLDDSSELSIREVWFDDERQPHNPAIDGVPRFIGNGPE